MVNLDNHPTMLTDRITSSSQNSTTRSQEYTRKLKHIYVGTFFIMYVSLIGFIQVKFHDDSPFETHAYLIIMSLVALPVAITTSGILFYTDDPIENTSISDIRYVILNFVFFFSTILAVLSLVLVLFVPAKFNWTGYAIICALFTFMVACNLCCYGRLHEKKDVPNSINLEMV
ncbi:hypothetical protein E3N88_35623 [Mikania micrantha]|uniref:Uncharacterized protein n=1 Tax=Mikania micrantha TaxID=192012 RepID=A0A5N6M488_9ASTR|nr:hypothetical protein E3N88_35623 [Mikania micrantha]